MKIFCLTLLIGLLSKMAYSQDFNLAGIISKAYSPAEMTAVTTKKLYYVVPYNIKFIDTSETVIDKNVKLVYLLKEKMPESKLSQAKDTFILIVYFDKMTPDEMEITLEIENTDADAYAQKFHVFIDKRKIKLIYNNQNKSWEYASLIRTYRY